MISPRPIHQRYFARAPNFENWVYRAVFSNHVGSSRAMVSRLRLTAKRDGQKKHHFWQSPRNRELGEKGIFKSGRKKKLGTFRAPQRRSNAKRYGLAGQLARKQKFFPPASIKHGRNRIRKRRYLGKSCTPRDKIRKGSTIEEGEEVIGGGKSRDDGKKNRQNF